MKKIKILTIILTVILISLVSFVGVYTQEQNRMENQIKDYKLGMNLSGYRQLRMGPETGDEENKIEITDEDVNKAKQILEKRLKKMGAQDYLIRASKDSIVIEMAEDENTDHIVSNVAVQGKFQILDSQTQEVLMNNDDIKLSNVLYSNTESGTMIYLNIEFNEEGTKKLEEITRKYKTIEETEETTTENQTDNETTTEDQTDNETTTEETTEETVQPKIIMKIDENEVLTQSFETPITVGKIQLAFSQAATTNEELQETINTVSTIAVILNNGMLPNEYSIIENEYVHSDITKDAIFKFAIIIAAIVLVALIVLIIKYKSRGMIASVLYVGIAALYLLILRYTNVIITLEGIAGILIILIIHYIITKRILEKNEKIIKEDPLPICIAVAVFCFIGWSEIASLGMVMFWGAVTLLCHKITIDVLNS